MLTYADVSGVDAAAGMLTYADVCWRMLYADVSGVDAAADAPAAKWHHSSKGGQRARVCGVAARGWGVGGTLTLLALLVQKYKFCRKRRARVCGAAACG